jgi:ribosomal protein S18 acetylase RimI-like enzyme
MPAPEPERRLNAPSPAAAFGLELRPTRPEDLPSLSLLFERRFGHPLAAAEWTWKYGQIPGRARSLVAIEAQGGEGSVIAHAGALLLPARWRGGEGGIWQLVDFVGSTARRGLRAALVAAGHALLSDLPAAGDAPWIFGFPSERHFRLGQRVFGYRPLAEVEVLEGALPVGGVSWGAAIESADLADEGSEALWEACGGLGVRRSAAFLNWRYYARPERYYRFYRLATGSARGFAVFAFVGTEAWAAELWLPEPSDWTAALRAVAADLAATGFRSWRFWNPSSLRLRGQLTSLGVHRAGRRQFVGCRGRPEEPDPAPYAAGFTFAMGDFDLV